jgi:ribonuclease P protein subunit RPR2
MKRDIAKEIATERIHILISNALRELKGGRDNIAEQHARLAKKIAMRLQLKLPYEIRQLYCKSCKRFITPGKNARVRIGRSRIKSIRITCLNCGHIYHKVVEKQKE